MPENLSFLAGKNALSMIRDGGLNPDQVRVVTGAAGGPKCLILNHLDGSIFSTWFADRKQPLFLLGSSAGAWRFAAVSQKKPLDAIDRFRTTYVHQDYSPKPSREEITSKSIDFLNTFLGDTGASEILNHPCFRLNMMSVRCRGCTASDTTGLLVPGLMLAALFNSVSRRSLRFFFERTLLYDGRDIPPFFDMNGFPIRQVPLTEENFKQALLASGSIPLIMSRVTDVPGARNGSYRDGGVMDYHMDIPFVKAGDDIILFPHYTDRIVPGWFDKRLPWRKPDPSNLDNLLLLHPSESFVKRLPYGKIPDRSDFKRFNGRRDERMNYWNKAIQESRRLGEEFLEVVNTGKIRERVRPLSL